jgi:8-oxo-dGTP pyrophosphatase MutT (NUDIX family)|tara:strand:- start:2621 stop:3277 length:657 start_codon:yes stop_codon:yes gene_type:complete
MRAEYNAQMLKTITNQLKKFPLDPAKPSPQDSGDTAAVLLLLHGSNENPQIVLTQRAMHLNNHAGEVAFPGGMWDTTDGSLLHTALRETHEEIGVPAELVEPIAMLPVSSPKRRNLQVTPFVGLALGPLEFCSEPSEIASIFDAPVSLFTDINNYDYFEIKNEVGALSFPCLPYNGYKIWGFTLNVIVDMLNATLDSGIDLKYPSDELIEELRARGQQ